MDKDMSSEIFAAETSKKYHNMVHHGEWMKVTLLVGKLLSSLTLSSIWSLDVLLALMFTMLDQGGHYLTCQSQKMVEGEWYFSRSQANNQDL